MREGKKCCYYVWLAYVLLVETNSFPNLSLFFRTMLSEYPSVLSRVCLIPFQCQFIMLSWSFLACKFCINFLCKFMMMKATMALKVIRFCFISLIIFLKKFIEHNSSCCVLIFEMYNFSTVCKRLLIIMHVIIHIPHIRSRISSLTSYGDIVNNDVRISDTLSWQPCSSPWCTSSLPIFVKPKLVVL